jgi:hypothetical protein
LTIPRQKSSDMLSLSSLECIYRKFSKQPRENLGIKKVVPQTECKARIGYIRYDNQCKYTWYALRFMNQNPRHSETTLITR